MRMKKVQVQENGFMASATTTSDLPASLANLLSIRKSDCYCWGARRRSQWAEREAGGLLGEQELESRRSSWWAEGAARCWASRSGRGSDTLGDQRSTASRSTCTRTGWPADRVGRARPIEQMPAGRGEEDKADHYTLTAKVTSVPRGSRTCSRGHAQLQCARRRPPRTPETKELGKGSSQLGCLGRGELRRGDQARMGSCRGGGGRWRCISAMGGGWQSRHWHLNVAEDAAGSRLLDETAMAGVRWSTMEDRQQLRYNAMTTHAAYHPLLAGGGRRSQPRPCHTGRCYSWSETCGSRAESRSGLCGIK
jgi:hypothetical protein